MPEVTPSDRTLKAGDIARLDKDALLLTPVGYQVPFCAGDQFAVLRLDGYGGVSVRSLDGYAYTASVDLFRFVRETTALAK